MNTRNTSKQSMGFTNLANAALMIILMVSYYTTDGELFAIISGLLLCASAVIGARHHDWPVNRSWRPTAAELADPMIATIPDEPRDRDDSSLARERMKSAA